MRILILIAFIASFTSNVNAQDIYSCYKIQNCKYDSKGELIVLKNIYDIDMPIIMDNKNISIRSNVYCIMNVSSNLKTKNYNRKTWNCYSAYKGESSFAVLTEYKNGKGEIGFTTLTITTKKGTERFCSIYTLRKY